MESLGTETGEDVVDDDCPGRGLHAKVLLSRRKNARGSLIIGSANFTGRALKGLNAELSARLSTSAAQADRLAKEIKNASFEYLPAKELKSTSTQAERARDEARAALVAELNPVIDFAPPVMNVFGAPPSGIAPGFTLRVAPLVRPELLSDWAEKSRQMTFNGVTDGDFSEWLAFELVDPKPRRQRRG